jgi:hypothetical protein
VKSSERCLRAILWLLALDAAIGGAVLVVGGRAAYTLLFPHLPVSEVSDLLLFKQLSWGGMGAALCVLLIAAARDPRGKPIIVWAMALGLAISGIAELASIWLLDVARLFPLVIIVAHSLTRLGIATALITLEKRLLADPSGEKNAF